MTNAATPEPSDRARTIVPFLLAHSTLYAWTVTVVLFGVFTWLGGMDFRIAGLVAACVSFVMTILGCLLIAFIINKLAPTFDGRPDFAQAFKTSVYSYTPGIVGGIARIVRELFGITGF